MLYEVIVSPRDAKNYSYTSRKEIAFTHTGRDHIEYHASNRTQPELLKWSFDRPLALYVN